jgi:hypothetical protein
MVEYHALELEKPPRTPTPPLAGVFSWLGAYGQAAPPDATPRKLGDVVQTVIPGGESICR